MFRYPCSYLIYTAQFDAMPAPLKDRVYRRLWEILTSDAPYGQLTAADRRAILGILRETKKDLPSYWRG